MGLGMLQELLKSSSVTDIDSKLGCVGNEFKTMSVFSVRPII